ncbi:unnamed protein product [Boreogadus saida]
MATGFDLRGFLADPSYESFSSCRKDDLVQIAAHFNLGHSRQILKRDLQGLEFAELLEWELVMLPVPAGPAERKGARGEKDSRESVQGMALLSATEPASEVSINADAERVFSVVGLNKTKTRNSLALDGTLSSIMTIKMADLEPCFKWEPPSDVLKASMKAKGQYNRAHRS